jgi:hypothetical protein
MSGDECLDLVPICFKQNRYFEFKLSLICGFVSILFMCFSLWVLLFMRIMIPDSYSCSDGGGNAPG